MDAPRTLEEVLGLSQISSDLRPREQTSAIDRVTALGFSDALGSLLIRLRVDLDHRCHAQAVDTVAYRLRTIGKNKGWGHMGRMQRVAAEAIRYHLLDMCRGCGGRGFVPSKYGPGIRESEEGAVCAECGGTGMAPRNVPGRARAIFQPGDIPKRLEDILEAADGIVGRALRRATGISKTKLYGWWSHSKEMGPQI